LKISNIASIIKFNRMKFLNYFIYLLVLVSCNEETKSINIQPLADTMQETVQTSKNNSILYFENALTYEIDKDGEKEEIWFFVNEKTKQILFQPKDEMIHAVISFPNGDYKIYASEEFKDHVVFTENIEAVLNNSIEKNVIKSNKKIKKIDQKNIQQKDIISEGFMMKYTQMEGSETLFATTQIPINAWQIYGFTRLDGDAKLSSDFDYLNVFQKNQVITHVFNPQLTLKLLNYGPNPFEFSVKEYQ
jgi:hypothetical protein